MDGQRRRHDWYRARSGQSHPSPIVDNLPTAPTSVTATASGSTSIQVAWSGATDDIGIQKYQVLRDGNQVAAPLTSPYTDTGLSPSTAYSYTIQTVDTLNQVSPASTAATATTLVAVGPQPDPVFTAGIADGARTNSTTETFSWASLTGATWWTQLDNDAWVNRGSATTVTLTGLHGATRHRFRVMSIVSGAQSRIAHREWDIVGPYSRVKFMTGTESCLVIPIQYGQYPPKYGTNAGAWTTVNTAIGGVAGWRAYDNNRLGVPSPPSGLNYNITGGARPSGASFAVISLKPDVAGLLAGTYDSALAAYAAAMPAGDWLTLWHEGETNDVDISGTALTPTNVKAMHAHAYPIVKAANPNISYVQIFACYSAQPAASQYPITQWVAPGMDYYSMDGYFNQPGATIANQFGAAEAQILAAQPGARFAITETNAKNEADRPAWFAAAYAHAKSLNMPVFFPFWQPTGFGGFQDWDATDTTTITELSRENTDSKLAESFQQPTGTPTDWQAQLDTINAYHQENSWGQFSFVFTLMPMISIPHPSASVAPSDPRYFGEFYTPMMAAADSAALAAGYDRNAYQHVYYMPPSIGDGMIGADLVVTNPSLTQPLVDLVPNGLDPTYIYGLNASTHEFGHSLGFSHANALDCGTQTLNPTTLAAAEADVNGGSGNVEYGNTTSTMGRGQPAAWVTLGVSNVKVTIAQQESVLGVAFNGERFNHQLYTLLPKSGLDAAYDAGKHVVYLNSDAHDSSSGTKLPIPWADVASGAWDSVLTTAAQTMKTDTRWTTTNPFIFSFHHEQTVNTAGQPGFTASGTPQDYINAYRHVRNLWDAQGATVRKANGQTNGGNTIFAFVPTDNSLRPGRARVDGNGLAWTGDVLDPDKGSSPAPAGTSYYELVGCDYYNRTAAGVLNDGNDPSIVLNALNAFALARGKQWIIGELACDDTPNVASGLKAAWIASLQTLIKSYGHGPGSCYALFWSDFDSATVDGGIPAYYNFDSSSDALAAAQALFTDPWFSGIGQFS